MVTLNQAASLVFLKRNRLMLTSDFPFTFPHLILITHTFHHNITHSFCVHLASRSGAGIEYGSLFCLYPVYTGAQMPKLQ